MKGFIAGVALVGFIFLLCIFSLAGHWFGVGMKAADAPASIADKAIDNTVDNSVANYEFFRDTYQAYNARVDQIQHFDKMPNADVDEQERERTELDGQIQSCRDIVASYNSAASKTNHNVMKNPPMGGPVLPDTLNLQECNAH